jgi:probable rRNA maturation factor
MIELNLQWVSVTAMPVTEAQIQFWAEVAVGDQDTDYSLTLRVVDEDESQSLNKAYRGMDKPTNILSFEGDPMDDLPQEVREALMEDELAHLGDLVICAPVLAQEAFEQGKTLEAHWAHMMVHGCLHLLGYDHLEEVQAQEMEQLERDILASLGYSDPYSSS